MSFLLDTDIGSAYPKKNQQVIRKVMLHFGGLHLSVIREGELLAKARRASATATRMQGIRNLWTTSTVLVVDPMVGEKFDTPITSR